MWNNIRNLFKKDKEKEKEKKNIKIITEGGTAVGKSWLIKKYLNKELTVTYGLREYFEIDKKITINNREIDITLKIFDNAGNEHCFSSETLMINLSDGVLLVYDITDKNSFEVVSNFLTLIRQLKPQNFPIVLIGNKSDLESKRQIQNEIAQNFATENNIRFFEVSSLTGENVNDAVDYLINAAYNNSNN